MLARVNHYGDRQGTSINVNGIEIIGKKGGSYKKVVAERFLRKGWYRPTPHALLEKRCIVSSYINNKHIL